jgi:hypothetical protein
LQASRVGRALAATVVTVALAACGGAGTTGPATGATSPATGAPPPVDDSAFAGRTYRLDLPADWVVLGSPDYDGTIDATPDVAAWLDALDLAGANAFRAHEPVAGAGGLRLYVNPASPWRVANDHPLRGGIPEKLAGVTDEPVGEMVPLGRAGKATRFTWTQEIDWGNGTPSARSVAGYDVFAELDGVYVVFTWPAGTDRLAEVDTMMQTFEVTGTAVASLPPGVTMPPSPTPFDGLNPPPEPPATAVPHAAPDLEALLPDVIGSVALQVSSQTGVEMGLAADDPILARFGKQPADLATATAMPDRPPLLAVEVTRLRGVSAADLLAAQLSQVPAEEVAEMSLAGRPAVYVTHGAWPIWYLPEGDLLYAMVGTEEQAAEAAAALP